MTNNVPKKEERIWDKKKVIIRAARLADSEDMKNVWRATFGDNIFGGELTYDQYLSWCYKRNPHSYPESVSQWVAEIDGEIIGAWSAMPVQLLVNGEKIAACWSQNTAIAPTARGLGLARKMFRSIIGRHRLTLGVGLTGDSRPLFTTEGVQFVRADRFAVLRLSRREVTKIVLRETYHLDLRSAWVSLQSAMRLLRILDATNLNVQVVEIKRFGAELDAFISLVTTAIPVMTYRNVEKLNWMIENPRIECKAFVALRTGVPCGYALVRCDGMILDLLTHPDDPEAFTSILKRIVAWSRKQAIREISAIIPGVSKLAAMYKASGFRQIEAVDFGLFYAFQDIKHRNETLNNPNNWYLSLADSDLWSWRL